MKRKGRICAHVSGRGAARWWCVKAGGSYTCVSLYTTGRQRKVTNPVVSVTSLTKWAAYIGPIPTHGVGVLRHRYAIMYLALLLII